MRSGIEGAGYLLHAMLTATIVFESGGGRDDICRNTVSVYVCIVRTRVLTVLVFYDDDLYSYTRTVRLLPKSLLMPQQSARLIRFRQFFINAICEQNKFQLIPIAPFNYAETVSLART